jgi:hypothetical protein
MLLRLHQVAEQHTGSISHTDLNGLISSSAQTPAAVLPENASAMIDVIQFCQTLQWDESFKVVRGNVKQPWVAMVR